jgi:hypothetical protein
VTISPTQASLHAIRRPSSTCCAGEVSVGTRTTSLPGTKVRTADVIADCAGEPRLLSLEHFDALAARDPARRVSALG